MTEIKLGQKVRDKITGVEGIAVERIEFLNGCIQFNVQRRLKKGEAITEDSVRGLSIDEQQLEVIETKKKSIKKSSNGGRMRLKKFY